MSDDQRYERIAAVLDWTPGEKNLRHEWNREHPDGLITEAEQLALEDRIAVGLEDQRRQ